MLTGDYKTLDQLKAELDPDKPMHRFLAALCESVVLRSASNSPRYSNEIGGGLDETAVNALITSSLATFRQSKILISNVNIPTTSMVALTGLEATVVNGGLYDGFFTCRFTGTVADTGWKCNLNAGNATVSSFRGIPIVPNARIRDFLIDYQGSDPTTLAPGQSLASITTELVSNANYDFNGIVTIFFSFTATSNGTFVPQFGRFESGSGTLTLERGAQLFLYKRN